MRLRRLSHISVLPHFKNLKNFIRLKNFSYETVLIR
jgi:hypothetical protein